MAETVSKPAVPFAVVALVGALTAGCASEPTPPAGPGTTAPTGASLAIPAVSNPLDANGFRDAPCGLVSDQQARDLGLPVASQEIAAGRPTCTWRTDRDNVTPFDALSIRVQTGSGLAAIARLCSSRSECAAWTVGTISDYPVIRANGRLESKYGMCRLFVGVADDVAFLVSDGDLDAVQKGATEGDAGGPRCDRADSAATIAIRTLKEGR